MFKIGEFSKLSKTTIKTLRYYDKINLFKPSFVDDNGYRYYSVSDLNKLINIIELRSIGFSIKEIFKIIENNNVNQILLSKIDKINYEISKKKQDISQIYKIKNQIEKGDYMEKYKAKEITIPQYDVYYRHGIIKSMQNIFDFILQAGAECKKHNPTLDCITPDYCYVTYEANEYQENDVELEFVQAVEKFGVESENIKFKTIPETKAICVEHKGSYLKLNEAYAFAVSYVKEHNYKIADKIREVYIHGCWDTEKEEDYLCEIQIPISK